MTPRDKVLAAVLGGLILAVVAGVGGYFGLYLPVQTRYANAARIEADAAEKAEKLAKLQKDMARLADAKRKSLPADPDLARREYEAALGRLLVAARAPRGYTVRPKSPDSRPVPEIGPKKPAYQRVAFEISLKKVDLPTLTDFLERYYRLNLLHQITRFHVKRTADPEGAAAARKGAAPDRADLDVTIVTEAAILDGAETRRALLPIPTAAGSVLTAAGLHHLTQSPELARGVAPPTTDPVLSGDRTYVAVVARDPFHGPLPPPVVPSLSVDSVKVADGSGATAAKFTVKLSAAYGLPVTVAYATRDDSAVADRDYAPTKGTLTFAPGETTKAVSVPLLDATGASDRTFTLSLSEPAGGATLGTASRGTATLVAESTPPKEDVSPFVKLTGITRRSDGSATADVKDAANNLDYQIDLKSRDGAITVKVVKYYYIKDRRKFLDSGTELDISDDTSSTARKFKVVGLDADGIVLTAVPPKPPEPARAAPGGGRFGPRPAAVVLPPAHPAAAVAGGPAAGVQQERVYVWRVGQSLKVVKELPGDEGRAAVARARGGWMPPTAGATVPTATTVAVPGEPARPASGLSIE